MNLDNDLLSWMNSVKLSCIPFFLDRMNPTDRLLAHGSGHAQPGMSVVEFFVMSMGAFHT